MALRIILKSPDGAEVLTQDIVNTEYPDIITKTGKSYVLRRLLQDKSRGYYVEATSILAL